MPVTDYQAHLWIASFPPLYLALFTTSTTSGGGGTECADVNYQRQLFTPSVSAGTSNSAAVINFPANARAYTIRGWGLMDAVAAGTMRWRNPSTFSPIAVPAGTQLQIPLSLLQISLPTT